MGGLGNQLFQYAIARSVALKRGDVLKLDATYFDEFKAHGGFRLNAFCIDAPLATIKEIKRLAPRSRLLHRLARKGIFHYKKKSFCIEKRTEESHFAPRVFDYKNDVYLSGYFCNEGYFADIRAVLLDDLKLLTPISKAAQAYLEQIKSSNGVSVHVRLGDIKNDCHKIGAKSVIGEVRKPMLSVEYYKNAIQRAREIQRDPIFFIFSNDIAWCKANLGFITNAVFIDQTQNELEDLELMRNCKLNIIANSTFSYWAAWLNINDGKRAIAPKIWYENWRGYDPCPSDWERA
jgi:hypothetical protein